jgi:hypothetical protein
VALVGADEQPFVGGVDQQGGQLLVVDRGVHFVVVAHVARYQAGVLADCVHYAV